FDFVQDKFSLSADLFFQVEDGIRDRNVTGVQMCALPISFANLARVLSQTGSPEAAEYMTKFKALQERQEATDRVRQLNNFALQAAKDNNWSQALGQMEEAIELCRDCPQLAVLRKNIGII